MSTVKVSPKYQVVIPRDVRDSLKIRPGQKFQVIAYDERIELIPLRKMKDMRGFIKGIDSTVKRDEDRA
jgi:AbrB family looped-hinge helix DNA binding protein